MLLQSPKSSIIYKQLKGNLKKKTFQACTLQYGNVGLKSLESGRIRYNEMAAVHKFLRMNVKNEGFIFTNICFDRCLTKKTVGSRMGKGKNSNFIWYSYISAGQILFEISNIDIKRCVFLLKKICYLLSINCKIVFKKDFINKN